MSIECFPGKQLPLTIYNSKTQTVRSVIVEPSETWGGQGLLGISIRFCSFEGANENVWHVLEVHPSSPADLAGLRSFTDYIIGADSVLHESEDLYALVENHEGRSLKLYVYNSVEDACREVTITPNSNWGGEGSLGCGIGYGYLHRIPVRGNPPNGNVSYPNANVLFNKSVDVASTKPVALEPDNSPNLQTPENTIEASAEDIQNANTEQSQPLLPPVNPIPQQVATNVPPPSSIPMMNPFPAQQTDAPPPMYSTVNTAPVMQHSSAPPLPFNVPVPNLASYNYPQLNASQPVHVPSGGSGTLPPPPLSGFQPTPLVYDPSIAAKSAQQLLSNASGTTTSS